MIKWIEKTYIFILYSFFSLYIILIYPWGDNYYYANAKAYYFIGCMFLLALLAISLRVARDDRFVWKITTPESLMVIFLILIACSTLFSVKKSLVGDGTEHQGILIMLSCFLLFCLASRLEPRHMERLCQLIIFSSFLAAVYSILQFHHLAFLPQDAVMQFGRRTFSFFDNPDYFGSYLTLVIPITFTAFLLTLKSKRSVLYFIILCTQLLSLLESQTRSAWIGVAIGFFIIAIWVVRKRKQLVKTLALMIVAFCLIFTVSSSFSHQNNASRALSITKDVQKIVKNQNAGSAGASRWYIWQVSMPLIANHFWLGTGPNTFEQVFPKDSSQTKKYFGNDKVYDENNDYLQIALTMGVPALLIYLLILSLILFKGFRKAEELDVQQQLASYGLLAAIIGYLVQAFFNISVISVAPYFWLLLGFVVNRNKESFHY
ncbi:O-antigen ligase family protein [Neobacillus massiliamazoniensis]|uniref:O-antigen polymerase n=1 Tax=Neobacillus massiliamazoniensis TaxID=1499688 RepID=A0A0U1NQ65_9BACI|nr:O-antigen ligase family protein [Neobacillus massiliamazoniensis]CRK80179.1 O-antigen polymerase [Neobacillus massiliamazoniensis]